MDVGIDGALAARGRKRLGGKPRDREAREKKQRTRTCAAPVSGGACLGDPFADVWVRI